MGDRYTCQTSPRHVWRPGGVPSSTRFGVGGPPLQKQATELHLEPASRATLRLNVNREVLRYCCWCFCGLRQKSLHHLGRYKPYKPCLGLAGRRRPDAAAAAREAQLALPRCHRASRARLTGLAFAGGGLWPPRARTPTASARRSAGRSRAAPAAGAFGSTREAEKKRGKRPRRRREA